MLLRQQLLIVSVDFFVLNVIVLRRLLLTDVREIVSDDRLLDVGLSVSE